MKNRNSGFTLVELMVVVLLVSLVVLVSTQIPLFTLSSWTKGSERLKLQRDAHYAMIKIQHELRPASLSKIIIDASDPSTLVVQRDTSTSFSVTSSSDGTVTLTDGENFVLGDDDDDTVAQFVVEKIWNVTTTDAVINVTLTLDKKNVGTIVLDTAVKPRN